MQEGGELVYGSSSATSQRASLFAAAGVIIDTKNWPFFFPILHHDISADIPEAQQWTQRLAYYTYLGKTWSLGLPEVVNSGTKGNDFHCFSTLCIVRTTYCGLRKPINESKNAKLSPTTCFWMPF